MIMGCNNDSNDTEPNVTAPTGGKVIAAEYRGIYIIETPVASPAAARQFEFTVNRIIRTDNNDTVEELSEAFTVDNNLYIFFDESYLWGYFSDNKLYIYCFRC
jgi:hypothetical protein